MRQPVYVNLLNNAGWRGRVQIESIVSSGADSVLSLYDAEAHKTKWSLDLSKVKAGVALPLASLPSPFIPHTNPYTSSAPYHALLWACSASAPLAQATTTDFSNLNPTLSM